MVLIVEYYHLQSMSGFRVCEGPHMPSHHKHSLLVENREDTLTVEESLFPTTASTELQTVKPSCSRDGHGRGCGRGPHGRGHCGGGSRLTLGGSEPAKESSVHCRLKRCRRALFAWIVLYAPIPEAFCPTPGPRTCTLGASKGLNPQDAGTLGTGDLCSQSIWRLQALIKSDFGLATLQVSG